MVTVKNELPCEYVEVKETIWRGSRSLVGSSFHRQGAEVQHIEKND